MTGYSEVTNAVAAMASIQSCERKKTKIVYNASNLNILLKIGKNIILTQFTEPDI